MAAPASAKPIHRPAVILPSKLEMIKANDLTAIGSQYARDFPVVLCGVATGVTCQPGMVPTFSNYRVLKAAIAGTGSGTDDTPTALTPGSTILVDFEPWAPTGSKEYAITPMQLKLGIRFSRMITQLCVAHGIKLIFTAWARGFYPELIFDAVAAKYGAAVVSLQTQVFDSKPAKFHRALVRAVATIRTASSTVTIWAGLATDAGGTPVTAQDMIKEYEQSYPIVAGFWENAAQWPHGIGCAIEGCPLVSAGFLRAVH